MTLPPDITLEDVARYEAKLKGGRAWLSGDQWFVSGDKPHLYDLPALTLDGADLLEWADLFIEPSLMVHRSVDGGVGWSLLWRKTDTSIGGGASSWAKAIRTAVLAAVRKEKGDAG